MKLLDMFVGGGEGERLNERGIIDVHDVLDLVDCETGVNLFHCLACVLHRVKRLLVDIGGFNAVDFALQGHYLRGGLLQGVLELLLSPEGGLGGCEMLVRRIQFPDLRKVKRWWRVGNR